MMSALGTKELHENNTRTSIGGRVVWINGNTPEGEGLDLCLRVVRRVRSPPYLRKLWLYNNL